MMHHHPLCLTLATTLSLGACDAMTDDSYRGELLLSLRGDVHNLRSAVLPDVHLYLVWYSLGYTPAVAEELEIEPKFPATFRLRVFNTPPVHPLDGPFAIPAEYPRLNLAQIVAATPDAEFESFYGFPWLHTDTHVLGADMRHFIYYMPDGLPEGTPGANLFHGPIGPGFHVYDIKCIGPAKRAEIEACLAQHRAYGPPFNTPEDFNLVMGACGSVNPDIPSLMPAAADLETELTVELMDDLPSWKPDPSECL
jgi:hypothetical protein